MQSGSFFHSIMLLDQSLIIKGATVGLSLIMAIGAQNAFVLKQGLLRQHIGWVCFICVLCDLILLSIGVLGFGRLVSQSPFLSILLTVAGSIFLLAYAFRSFYQAFKSTNALEVTTCATEKKNQPSAHKMVATTLTITLLNPHVYLDTVVLIGGITATLPDSGKFSFLLGACFASAIWFCSLGFGARYLRPLFQKPCAWRILEFLVGCLMLWIASGLLRFLHPLLF